MNQNTEILELEITQADIKRSIERRESRTEMLCDCCVVSTAAQRQLGDPKLASGMGDIYDASDNPVWLGGNELSEYMNLFDGRRYELLHPRKFILTKVS